MLVKEAAAAVAGGADSGPDLRKRAEVWFSSLAVGERSRLLTFEDPAWCMLAANMAARLDRRAFAGQEVRFEVQPPPASGGGGGARYGCGVNGVLRSGGVRWVLRCRVLWRRGGVVEGRNSGLRIFFEGVLSRAASHGPFATNCANNSGTNRFAPRTDDLYDLYDLFLLHDLDISMQMYS